jgi:DNA (cytosine-5)-methyltransferase 1
VIARQFGNSIGHRADEPGATVTAGGGGKSQLVSATMIQMGYGERKGQAPRILQIGKPLGTVTAGGNKFAVVAANLVKHFGGNYSGSGLALDEPVHTVTTTDHHALVTSSIVKMRGTNIGQPTDTPLQTVTAGGLHFGEVRTMLAENEYDEHRAGQVAAFLHEYGISEFVTIEVWCIALLISACACSSRASCTRQGFPEWYIIDRTIAA